MTSETADRCLQRALAQRETCLGLAVPLLHFSGVLQAPAVAPLLTCRYDSSAALSSRTVAVRFFGPRLHNKCSDAEEGQRANHYGPHADARKIELPPLRLRIGDTHFWRTSVSCGGSGNNDTTFCISHFPKFRCKKKLKIWQNASQRCLFVLSFYAIFVNEFEKCSEKKDSRLK